jgi:hyaluronoglucosaminidase
MSRTARITAVVVALAAGASITAVAVAGRGGGDDPSAGGARPGAPAEDTTTTAGPTTTRRPADAPLPTVVPAPHQIAWLGPDVVVPERVVLHAGEAADEPTRAMVDLTLRAAGASEIAVATAGDDGGEDGDGVDDDAALDVWLGTLDDPAIPAALDRTGVAPTDGLGAEGYVLAAFGGDDPALVLGGVDGDGLYYAAQTLRQVVVADTVLGVSVVDQPSLPRRGVVEGFYGSPWTPAERADQMAFYGDMKLNTYIYAPKADPFHRDRWREPYPPDQLAQLGTLVDAARAHHVRFTFAVSPGLSICFTDPDDVAALEAKLNALYDLGVRDFAMAFDDIDRDDWHCAGDRSAYGPRSGNAEAAAQVALVNDLQQGFVADHPGTRPLVFVPTEYRGVDDSPYRATLRDGLDPAVLVMWTGRLVGPAEITASEAAAARGVYGRPTFIWDNFPVNDWPRTEGRLLLAPYARRAADIVTEISGITSNPMNQAAASKVALVGVADFTWNAPAYDPGRAHRAAAERLAGGPGNGSDQAAATVDALLAFFDVENLAPTSSRDPGVVSQVQAPALHHRLVQFRDAWTAGDESGAVARLRPYAQLLAGAPAQIRSGVADAAFVADCRPWLDALALWGQALVTTLDGLDARIAGDTATADADLRQAAALADQAAAIRTIEGETLPQGPVHVADGVLDTFLAAAPSLP